MLQYSIYSSVHHGFWYSTGQACIQGVSQVNLPFPAPSLGPNLKYYLGPAAGGEAMGPLALPKNSESLKYTPFSPQNGAIFYAPVA